MYSTVHKLSATAKTHTSALHRMRLTTSFHQNNMVQQPAFACSGNAPHNHIDAAHRNTPWRRTPSSAWHGVQQNPVKPRDPVLCFTTIAWFGLHSCWGVTDTSSEKCAYALRSLARTTCFDQEHRARAYSQSETWCFPGIVHGHCLCNIVEILVMKPFVSASLHTSENSVETSIWTGIAV